MPKLFYTDFALFLNGKKGKCDSFKLEMTISIKH